MTRAVQVSVPPVRTGARKLTFISALAQNTLRPRAEVRAAAPMAESQQAARKPPWRIPTGFAKRSSAGICHTVVPGTDLSTQVMPRVRSQLGGTCTRGSATARRYRTGPVAPSEPGSARTAATPTPDTLVLRAASVVTEAGVLEDAEVVLAGDRIDALRPATGPVDDVVLVPGFVELQVNGIGPVDVAGADGDDWAVLDDALLAQGVTTWCPTLTSAPTGALEAALGRIARAAARPDAGRPAIAGAHVEGPFLALPGAHRPEALRGTVDGRWLAELSGAARVVTLAPELPGALAAVSLLAERGVVVGLGHSACDAETARAAADAGARLVTHLGNAMTPLRTRDPGLVGAALTDDRLAVSLICDLVHAHPVFVRLAFAAKGPDAVVLVTDAVAASAGTGSPPRLADGTLAGSVLTMPEAVTNAVAAAGVDLARAVAAAATTPARLLGLEDRGVLAVGRRADVVALRADGRGALVVAGVWVGGRPAWPR